MYLHLTKNNTSVIYKVSYKIIFWHNLVTVIPKCQPDTQARAVNKQYYVDTVMMHSTGMAVAHYGGDTANLPMSDPQQVVECIKAGLTWHRVLNIGQKEPLSVNIDREIEVLEVSNPSMF